jgi:hypothetical protein
MNQQIGLKYFTSRLSDHRKQRITENQALWALKKQAERANSKILIMLPSTDKKVLEDSFIQLMLDFWYKKYREAKDGYAIY